MYYASHEKTRYCMTALNLCEVLGVFKYLEIEISVVVARSLGGKIRELFFNGYGSVLWDENSAGD